jgi:hypothetical protein
MSKIRINGEAFDYDQSHHPMSEALAIEEAMGMRYVDWEAELAAGSMRAMCGFVWLVWRRGGRDVDIKSILSGATEIDLDELLASLMEARQEAEAEPTAGTARPRSAPAPTPTTGTGTSRSSRSTSGSARGRSASDR